MEFEMLPPDYGTEPDLTTYVEPVYTGDSERHVLYPDGCDYCGGTCWDIGGRSYYNGSYQCYTLYLECENCGTYDVECV